MQSRFAPSLVCTFASRRIAVTARARGRRPDGVFASPGRAVATQLAAPASTLFSRQWANVVIAESSPHSAASRIASRRCASRSEGHAEEERQYTQEEVTAWRANFRFPRRQHSLAQVGYTDDELLAWRVPFDQVSDENKISYEAFERLVRSKYSGIVDDERLYQKVFGFWVKFDKDRNDFIDFGEFMKAGLHFNVDHAKEKIRVEGVTTVFLRYAAEDYISEEGVLQLMEDYHFFAITATDMQKVMKVADGDRDGLISSEDFKHWMTAPTDRKTSLDLPKTMSQHRAMVSPKQRRARRAP